MVYVLTKLKIPSYGRWKSAFEGRSRIRKETGSEGAIAFRNSYEHEEVVILFRWNNMENARKFFESDLIQNILLDARAKLIKITYLDQIEATI
jgi:heme-degrading monooxygenase HmoA